MIPSPIGTCFVHEPSDPKWVDYWRVQVRHDGVLASLVVFPEEDRPGMTTPKPTGMSTFVFRVEMRRAGEEPGITVIVEVTGRSDRRPSHDEVVSAFMAQAQLTFDMRLIEEQHHME